MRKISEKRLSKLGGRVPSSTITGTRKPIRKKPRKPSEFARIYGSKERMEFVKSLPCAACGVVGYSENAHLLGSGGLSRKAGYETIAPLCGVHAFYAPFAKVWYVGCHHLFDRIRWDFDLKFPDFDPEKVAAETQARWLAIADKGGV